MQLGHFRAKHHAYKTGTRWDCHGLLLVDNANANHQHASKQLESQKQQKQEENQYISLLKVN